MAVVIAERIDIRPEWPSELAAVVTDLTAMLGRFTGARTQVTIADRIRPVAELH